MPRKQIKRKCGHIENIYLEDREFNDPAALKHHEDELCEKSYVDYKIEYISCRTKEGSYDGKNKTIVVYVPYDF